MNISKVDQCRIRDYNREQVNLQKKREDDYRKVIERQNFERIVSERASRSLHVDLDKGRNVDVEC